MRPRAKQLKTAAVSHHGAPSSIDARLPLPATTDGISDRLGMWIGLSPEGACGHVQGLQGTPALSARACVHFKGGERKCPNGGCHMRRLRRPRWGSNASCHASSIDCSNLTVLVLYAHVASHSTRSGRVPAMTSSTTDRPGHGQDALVTVNL